MAISLLGHKAVGGINGATTAAMDTTGASIIILGVVYQATLTGPSDSQSNTWTPLTLYDNGSQALRIFYSVSPTTDAAHTFTIGGTSILIVVSVVLETVKQIEAQLVMRNYEGFLKKSRIKGRWFNVR